MKKGLNFIIKIKKKFENIIIRIKYTSYFERLSINNNVVLAQTYAGTNFSGNIYYIVQEMLKRTDKKNLKFYVAVTKGKYKEISRFIKLKFGTNIEVLKIGSNKYLKILTSAKYLLNNVAFPTYFIKKQDQIYLNTWHGTPLKGLGRSILDAPNESGNYQRNFLMTDYLLFPNWYTFDHMREDYMIGNFFKGNYLLSGYPRNSIFYDKTYREELRKKYNLLDKEVIIYMPTWRRKEKGNKQDIQIVKIIEFLDYLEKKLRKNQILFVKLHNLVNSQIDFSKYNKIQTFPEELETSEFLSATDALITDYSSVMFDYMNCNKKIILYTYDYEEYINGRSVYFDINNLPFPLCLEKEDVLKEISDINKFTEYDDVRDNFCEFDKLDVTKKIVDLLLYGDKSDLNIINGEKYNNNQLNVLIYSTKLAVGKPTYNLMNSLDTLPTNINFFLNFYNHKINNNKEIINEIPKTVSYITLQGARLIKIKEAICYRLYYKFGITSKKIEENIDKIYKREIQRLYPNMNFDYVINYSGEGTPATNMYSLMNGKKYLFLNITKINSKKKLKTLKMRIKKYDKIYVNNIQIIDCLKENNIENSNIVCYSDKLVDFKEIFNNLFI